MPAQLAYKNVIKDILVLRRISLHTGGKPKIHLSRLILEVMDGHENIATSGGQHVGAHEGLYLLPQAVHDGMVTVENLLRASGMCR